jgi:hypothetical protein
MKRIPVLVGCVVAALLAGGALATENGGGAYPNGAEDLMSGALPPPGDYLITYGLFYQADVLKDGAGNDVPIDFDLEVSGAVFRYVRVTDIPVAGGLWAQHVFVPVLNVDVTTPAGSDSTFGLGDLIVDPVIVSWHKPPFHWAAGVDVFVPVGEYDKDEAANIGRNYWTFEPVVAASFLCPCGVDASAKLMYDINLENEDTDYRSGDEFHADLALGQTVGAWRIGVNGFFYRQVTGDEAAEGEEAGPDGSQMGAGPVIGYQAGKLSVLAKYQAEFETEGRPEGDRFWIKLIHPL